MPYCILAKFFTTLTAVLFLIKCDINPLVQAFLIGIAPIWSEVLISQLTNIEPAREKRQALLITDALVDIISFILVPMIWYFNLNKPSSYLVQVSLTLFLLSGIFRILRFLRNGLDDRGYFSGLPVTYTGYTWILITAVNNFDSTYIPTTLLICLSWAMLSKHIKIPASH